MRANEFHMCLVTQPFGVGDREKTLVDLSRRQSGRHSRKGRALPATQLLAIERIPEARHVLSAQTSARRASSKGRNRKPLTIHMIPPATPTMKLAAPKRIDRVSPSL